jgi:hypothetical protein
MSMKSGIETAVDGRLSPGAVIYRCNRILSKWPGLRLNRYIFTYQPLATLPAPLRAYPAQLFTADTPDLAALWPDPAVRAYRFAQGARCLVVRSGDRLAGGIWFTDGCYAEDEVRAAYCFDTMTSWDFGLFIHPDFRHTRAFAALWGAAKTDLQARGRRGTLSRIADYLAPSLLAHKRMGAKYVGHATFLACGSRQWCWPSGVAKPVMIQSRPHFHFDTMAF